MKKYQVAILAVFLLTTIVVSLAQVPKPKKAPAAAHKAHIMVAPEDVKWGPIPASWIQGTPPPEFAGPMQTQISVIQGDPLKPGLYVIRIKAPDGEKVPPHWHPQDEHITILQGTFVLATGDKFDENAGQELTTGTYALMPKGVRHFARVKGETILQAHGMGPFKIIFVGPAAKASKKTSSAQ